jgi:EpsI family protein
VAYYDKQTDGPLTHSPRECLPGAGWEFVSLQTIPAPVAAGDGTGFDLNRAVISDGETRMMMYYWYEQGGQRFTEESYARLHLLISSLRTGRTDGALVRLLTPFPHGEDPGLAEARLSSFLKLVYPALEPHVGA